MNEEQQIRKFWQANPASDYDLFKSILREVLEKDQSYTVDSLYKKYKEYDHWWNTVYGKRDSKYIGRNDAKMNVTDWLLSDGFVKNYENPNKLREEYLFGEMNYEEFQEKYRAFKSQFRKGTSTGD